MLFWVPEFTLRVPTRLSPYGNARGGGAFESSFLSKHASSPREASLWAKLSEWDEALVHPACCGTFSQPDEEMSVLNTFTLRVSAVALMVSTEFINCPTIKVFFCFFLDNILHQLLLIFKILPWKLESRFFFSDLFIPELYKLLFILAVLQFVISVSVHPLLSNHFIFQLSSWMCQSLVKTSLLEGNCFP